MNSLIFGIISGLIILQLFVFKFPIRKFIKNQINKITGKIELLELKNTRFYDETKLLKELDLTEARELYQLIMSLSKSPTLIKEQTIDICLEAVKQHGLALRFVINQTPLIIHYLKKYHILIYESFKKENRITIPDNEMKKFYNENPHLLLTL